MNRRRHMAEFYWLRDPGMEITFRLFDHALGRVGFYTAMNSPYQSEICRKYSHLVHDESQRIERIFAAGIAAAARESGEG